MEKGVTRFWVKVAVATVLIGTAFYYLLQVKIISIPILISLILAILAEPLVVRLECRGWSRTRVVICMMLVTVAAIGTAALLWGESAKIELVAYVTEAFPRAQQRLLELVRAAEIYLRTELPFSVEVDLQSKLGAVTDDIQDSVMSDLPAFLGKMIAGALVVPIVTFFFIKDARTIRHNLVAMVPNQYFEMTLMIIHRTGQQIGNFIRGVGKQSFFVGLVDLVALLIVGVGIGPALFLAVFGGVINAIPYVGPVIGYGVGALVALAMPGDPPILGIILAMVCGQLADNIVIGPLLLGSAVDMHPIMVIILCVIGGTVMGVLGLILVVPLFAVARVIIQELWIGVRTYRRFLD